MATHVETDRAREAVRIARAILSGETGVLEGCIPLASIAHDVVQDWRVDPDFVIFGAVASEVDALPFGEVRRHWSSAALARADVEIARYTEVMKEQVLRACQNVVGRFEPHLTLVRSNNSLERTPEK
jgi:Protein of unknown function (DUF2489)